MTVTANQFAALAEVVEPDEVPQDESTAGTSLTESTENSYLITDDWWWVTADLGGRAGRRR